MRKLLVATLASILILLALCASAQVIPTTKAETVGGKKVALPDAALGHVNVFIVGFSRKSKDPSKDWGKQLLRAWEKDKSVQVYELAMLEGAPRFVRGMIVSGIRKDSPHDLEDNFLVAFEGADAWKNWVGFSAPDDAYIVVTDKSGNAQWKTNGPATDAAITDVKKVVEKLKAEPATK